MTDHASGDVPAGLPGAGHPASGLGWLLDDLLTRTGAVRQAVLLTEDGLPICASQGLDARTIEHLAAVCSGFHSLADEAATRFATGGVRQVMVMLDDAYLFVTPAGDGSRLAVLAASEVDVGQLAHEMALLVKQVGQHMGVPARPGPGHRDV